MTKHLTLDEVIKASIEAVMNKTLAFYIEVMAAVKSAEMVRKFGANETATLDCLLSSLNEALQKEKKND